MNSQERSPEPRYCLNVLSISLHAGFTLIELLVVVLIIGILAAVAVPQYQDAVSKSRLVRWLELGRSLSEAQNLYYLANGSFSGSFSELDIMLPADAEIYDTGLSGGAGQRAYFNMNRGSSSNSMAGERVRVDLQPAHSERAGTIQMQVNFTDNNEMWFTFYPQTYANKTYAGRIICSGNGASVALCGKLAGGESRRISAASSGYYLN